MSRETSTGPIAIIADDEELGRLLLAESAAATGLEVLAFDNGAAALEASLSQEIAVVLLDVDMPGMDGYSVCRRLPGRAALGHRPHRHGHRPRGRGRDQPGIRGRRNRFHFQTRQLGAAAAPDRVHPAQRRIRASAGRTRGAGAHAHRRASGHFVGGRAGRQHPLESECGKSLGCARPAAMPARCTGGDPADGAGRSAAQPRVPRGRSVRHAPLV